MRTRLQLESLDGRIVPDATPTETPTPVPVETQPSETPWTAEEIDKLRSVVNQLEQWGNEAGSYFTQMSTCLAAQGTYLDWLEQENAALANGAPPAGQEPVMPVKPGPIQGLVLLFQQVRDLPGNPLQTAVQLTLQAKTLADESSRIFDVVQTHADNARQLRNAAAQTNDPAERARLLNASNDAVQQSRYWREQSSQLSAQAIYIITVQRVPAMQQLKAFIQSQTPPPVIPTVTPPPQ